MALLDLQMLELPANATVGRNSGASKNCASALSLLLC
jgi:hypothetical protein